jgi:hypothetical protein
VVPIGVDLGPYAVVPHRPTVVRIEERLLDLLPDHEREVHHSPVQGHRPIVVAGVAKRLQPGDDDCRVVGDNAPDVEQLVPEVVLEARLGVVPRHVRGVPVADILLPDLVHLADVERPIVGEIEVTLALLIVRQLGGDRQDLGEVLELVLAVG